MAKCESIGERDILVRSRNQTGSGQMVTWESHSIPFRFKFTFRPLIFIGALTFSRTNKPCTSTKHFLSHGNLHLLFLLPSILTSFLFFTICLVTYSFQSYQIISIYQLRLVVYYLEFLIVHNNTLIVLIGYSSNAC